MGNASASEERLCRMRLGLLKTVTVAVAAGLLAGCASVPAHKGVVLDIPLANSIQPGIDNKASVEKLLGRPTFTGQFTPDDWYYVARDTRQVAFRNPRVTWQTTVLIHFDKAGNVVSMQHAGKELAMNLDPSKRSTPTLGRKKSFFEELFGGIGSVNSGGIPTQ
jgi:outer membrane protein assembly factor BamE (lipoprotein component of BamABCDE complex)